MSERHYDLVIVGGGLVGAALALQLVPLLAREGRRLALVEASPAEPPVYRQDQFDPRVVALTPGSRDLLETLGLWHQIADERVCPYEQMQVWDGEGSGRIDFHADCLGVESLGYIVENSVLLRHLRRALDYQPAVDWYRPASVSALESAGDERRVRLDSGEQLRAPLVVGADGARSRVRELAGIDLHERAYDQRAIVTTVRTERPHGGVARQRFMATGPLAFLPLRCRWGTGEADHWDRHYCSIVWSADEALARELMALEEAAFARRLARDFEYTLGEVESAGRRHALPLYRRHARRYTAAGVVLVGDAAHSIHPLAGQGLNLGLEDTRALTEELARALARGLPLSEPAMGRRYQRRRLEDNLGTMAVMDGFKRLFGSRDPAAILLRNSGLRWVDALPLVKHTLARKAMGV